MRTMTKAAAAAAGAAIAITSGIGTASADPTDYDPAFQPNGGDIAGVGSDTTQFVMDDLAQAYNLDPDETVPPRAASWDAINPDTGEVGDLIWVKDADSDGVQDPNELIVRPNGSSDGIDALRFDEACDGASDHPVDFARSSRPRRAGDSECDGATGGPQVLFLPFATDNLGYAVNADNAAVGEFPGDAAGTNAPLDLTTAELVDIYDCTDTLWSEVRAGLPAEAINPLAPQEGSGTRQAFLDSLGLDAFGACVDDTVQEHDALPIDGDPNAIAPFSVGRFNTEVPADANGDKPVQLNTAGYELVRPLFNVVVDQTPTDGTGPGGIDPDLHGFFGDNNGDFGWICSDDAKPVIEAAGFTQLGTLAEGEFTNPCGVGQ